MREASICTRLSIKTFPQCSHSMDRGVALLTCCCEAISSATEPRQCHAIAAWPSGIAAPISSIATSPEWSPCSADLFGSPSVSESTPATMGPMALAPVQQTSAMPVVVARRCAGTTAICLRAPGPSSLRQQLSKQWQWQAAPAAPHELVLHTTTKLFERQKGRQLTRCSDSVRSGRTARERES